jgi:hypothetical protein
MSIITLPDQLKIRLIISDRFSLSDFGLSPGSFRDFSIAQITANEAREYMSSNDSYYNDPRLYTQPAKDIISNILEVDLTKNHESPACLDDETAIIYITMDADLNPKYYLAV